MQTAGAGVLSLTRVQGNFPFTASKAGSRQIVQRLDHRRPDPEIREPHLQTMPLGATAHRTDKIARCLRKQAEAQQRPSHPVLRPLQAQDALYSRLHGAKTLEISTSRTFTPGYSGPRRESSLPAPFPPPISDIEHGDGPFLGYFFFAAQRGLAKRPPFRDCQNAQNRSLNPICL